MENRRGFVGKAITGIAAFFGLSQIAKAKDNWLDKGLNHLQRFSKDIIVKGKDQVFLYTQRHKFSIAVKPNYIGAVMSNRFPLPGEDWTRGRDLADGPNTEETWNRILLDILAVELVRPGWQTVAKDASR